MADRTGRRWFNSIPGLCGLVVGAGVVFTALRLASESWVILVVALTLGIWGYASMGAPGVAETQRGEWQVFAFSGMAVFMFSVGSLWFSPQPSVIANGLDLFFPYLVRFDPSDDERLGTDWIFPETEESRATHLADLRWRSDQHRRFLAIGFCLISLAVGVLAAQLSRTLKSQRAKSFETRTPNPGR